VNARPTRPVTILISRPRCHFDLAVFVPWDSRSPFFQKLRWPTLASALPGWLFQHRQVLMSLADGFIACSSAAPTNPFVLGLKMRWIVRMSAVWKSSSFETSRAPHDRAFSFVRFWLQAITSIPNARPMRATSEPRQGDREHVRPPAMLRSYLFLLSRKGIGSASSKMRTSSPVIVLMSWCRLRTLMPVTS